MKIFLIFFAIAMFSFGMNAYPISQGEHSEDSNTESVEQDTHHGSEIIHEKEGHHEAGHKEDAHEEHEEGGHHGGMEPLFFVIIALVIGAATRHFLQKSFLPFTVLLLLFGIAIGVAFNLEIFTPELYGLARSADPDHKSLIEIFLDTIQESINWAGTIDPHLILFVFLPTLIFEAAFAMDVHTFKKTVTNAIILAIPGIIVAMFLTAAIMIGINKSGLGLFEWNWEYALLFGIVISATDPVAVVALLKELGASKKLGTLIEGESLLNDGTAIVIFLVLIGIINQVPGASPAIQFVQVAFGGVLLGLIIGGVTIAWVKKVFNDAMVEITVIVAAAYLTFYITEGFLHVSGVLGLVALGLVMASVGRTRISPEVEHFLHEFWELAAFIANTLIFIIVGVVIATQTSFEAMDFLILGIIYIGVHIVRAIVILLFYPLMRRIGYGLPKKDAYVVWYGALRGAIGLALALMVAGYAFIPETIRGQFLFYTAGIVTLTLLVNATTIKYLIRNLGLTKIPPAKALMIMNAKHYLRQSSENAIDRIKSDRYMNRANWNKVREYLPEEVEKDDTLQEQIETIAETRRRILEKEKSSYWHQFKDGLIGAQAVQTLSDGINEVLDAGGLISLAERKDLEEMWKTPKILNKMLTLPLIGKWAEGRFVDKLSISYDCARGFVEAQEEALKLVESMNRSLEENDKDGEKNLAIIEEEINENKIHGQTFIRNLRKNYPEIYTAIATRQAIRSVLNYELRTVERLQKNGRIDSGEAQKMTIQIEERMKKLFDSPPTIELPETIELLKEVPWLQGLDKDIFNRVTELFQNRVFAVGDDLMKEGTPGDSLYIIVRGTVKVTIGDDVVDLLGAGSTVGEMAVLLGTQRTATVTAESPVTTLRMKYLKIHRLMQDSKALEDRLWEIAGKRKAENLLGQVEPFSILRKKQFGKIVAQGSFITPAKGETLELKDQAAVLLIGKAVSDDRSKNYVSPQVIDSGKVIFETDARVFLCSESHE